MTTNEGVLEENCTEETTPVIGVEPAEGVSVTVCPMSESAWMLDKSVSVSCAVCKALNCASWAAKSVSLSGFNGSCELIWVTSNLRKSAWSNVCDGRICEVLAEVVDAMDADIGVRPKIPSFAGNGLGSFVGVVARPGRRVRPAAIPRARALAGVAIDLASVENPMA